MFLLLCPTSELEEYLVMHVIPSENMLLLAATTAIDWKDLDPVPSVTV